MEDLDAYRTACANRIRRLERYKKARSFCSLETDEPTSSTSPTGADSTGSDGASTFDMIREKMVSSHATWQVSRGSAARDHL